MTNAISALPLNAITDIKHCPHDVDQKTQDEHFEKTAVEAHL
jgi:hypothetical protein